MKNYLANHEAAQVCLEFLTSHFKGCQHISIQKIKIKEFNGSLGGDRLNGQALISLQVLVRASKENPETTATREQEAKNQSAASSVLTGLSGVESDCSSNNKNLL